MGTRSSERKKGGGPGGLEVLGFSGERWASDKIPPARVAKTTEITQTSVPPLGLAVAFPRAILPYETGSKASIPCSGLSWEPGSLSALKNIGFLCGRRATSCIIIPNVMNNRQTCATLGSLLADTGQSWLDDID